METAFTALKAALVAAVPLANPLPGAFLALATDASDTHVGAVLQQQVGQHWLIKQIKTSPYSRTVKVDPETQRQDRRRSMPACTGGCAMV
jgi:hypothetical protein